MKQLTKFSGFFGQSGKPKPSAPIIAQEISPLDARTLAENQAKLIADAQRKHHEHQESGGPQGLEPTRYNDWEHAGRCIDF